MIVTTWINQSPDPHYGHNYDDGRRPADWSQVSVLDTIGGRPVTVLTDCLPPSNEPNVNVVRVDPLGGNPYHDRWRHLLAWLPEYPDGWVWSVDANDVALLNEPVDLDPDVLYVGSEPFDGPDARTVGFWWMRGLHPDHTEWIADHADLPLLNAGLLGGTPKVMTEFVAALVSALADCPNDVTDMAAVNRLLHDEWTGRMLTGHPVHTPMWSFVTTDPFAWWAHK